MKKNLFKICIIFIAVVMISTSCKDDDESITPPVLPDCEEEYILFGHFYGECFGEECIEIFRLCESTLFEDSNDIYPSSQVEAYDGNFTTLSNQEDYEAVRDLIMGIPDSLFMETAKILGQPDAGDWGGYYLEIKKENEAVQYWLIDTVKESIPTYLRDYTDNIQAAIALINE